MIDPILRPFGLAMLRAAVLVLFMTMPNARTAGAEPVSSRLAPALARLASNDPDEPVVAWVYFTDRAGAERNPAAFRSIRPLVSARALERRVSRGVTVGLDAGDLPVHEAYVRAVTARGAHVRGTSRWLNAASAEMTAGLAAELAKLPFVARVEPVPVGRPIPRIEDPFPANSSPNVEGSLRAESTPGATTLALGDTAYYGATFRQLAMMQVPQVHQLGITGAGVLVCMLDSGFRTTHQVFAGLDVLARRDFIYGDTNVDVDSLQDAPSQASHGTMTLACVAGSKPGTFSGVAPGVTVALGKTENISSERPVEMDYWQFGAEWADSLGADIISSSLGYSDFDSGYVSYGYADMDGRTTVVARAAAEAARRGIVVVNSAGNSGSFKIISPADADTVIAVGAVDSLNVVTGFSSRGPTADGRIKPDVTAMGRAVYVPAFTAVNTYVRVNGTSFSCPLTAGAAALILQQHPNWGPFEVREALRESALNHASPDTLKGWGLVQVVSALAHIPSTVSVPDPIGVSGLALAVGPNPMRTGGELVVRFAAPDDRRVDVEVIDLAGRRVARLYSGTAASGRTVTWDARRARAGAGVYWVRVRSESGESTARRVVALD